jgi:hypothetical protein
LKDPFSSFKLMQATTEAVGTVAFSSPSPQKQKLLPVYRDYIGQILYRIFCG